MHVPFLFQVASKLSMVFEVLLAVIVVRKKLWREVPAFSCYILFGLIGDIACEWAMHDGYRYFWVYTIVDWIYKMLTVWMTLEIYKRLTTKFPGIQTTALRLLSVAVAFMLLVAGVAYLYSDFAKVPSESILLISLGRAFRLGDIGLLCALFFVVRSFGLRLRQYYVWIATGLSLPKSGADARPSETNAAIQAGL